MKLNELLTGLDVIELHADADMEICDICYDSRKAGAGDLFVAVKGYESDGYEFIEKAVAGGCICVLCERKPEIDIPYVITSNSRLALAITSKNYFGDPASEMKLIGVTGTNGKTTVTHLIKTIIEIIEHSKVGLIGTNHNLIGDDVIETERTTPESYEFQRLLRKMADAECKYVVMEVSSHALFLDRVSGVTFEIGAFTNLTRDHLDFHKTMDDYAAAKSILFGMSRNAVINLDDDYAQVMIESSKCPVTTYSKDRNEADVVAKAIKLSSDCVDFCALTLGDLQRVRLGIPGMFSVYNALTAMTVAKLLGYSMEEIADAVGQCSGVNGRAEVVPTGNRGFTIIIDYAHTPDALENIIKTVRESTEGRVVTLFGCGGDRDKTKRPIMGAIASELSDFVIVTSDNPRTEKPDAIIKNIVAGIKSRKCETPYVVIENRREAIGYAIEHAEKDDVIILAGKGHETYQIIGKQKNHFDEREVCAEFLM